MKQANIITLQKKKSRQHTYDQTGDGVGIATKETARCTSCEHLGTSTKEFQAEYEPVKEEEYAC